MFQKNISVMPELLFLMYFTFLAYISANIMSVWCIWCIGNLLSVISTFCFLSSQMFAFCLPLSLKLSLRTELQFLVESLQLHETCRTREPFYISQAQTAARQCLDCTCGEGLMC